MDPLAVTPMPKTCPAWSDEKRGKCGGKVAKRRKGLQKGFYTCSACGTSYGRG